MPRHTTTKLGILVDAGIEPLITWLNKFKHVTTTYSCEGDRVKDTDVRRGAYVSFLRTDLLTLQYVLRRLEPYCRTGIRGCTESECTLYHSRLTFTVRLLRLPTKTILDTIPTF